MREGGGRERGMEGGGRVGTTFSKVLKKTNKSSLRFTSLLVQHSLKV